MRDVRGQMGSLLRRVKIFLRFIFIESDSEQIQVHLSRKFLEINYVPLLT